MSRSTWISFIVLVLAAWSSALVAAEQSIRFATFNVSLNFDQAGALRTQLDGGQWQSARKVAAIIQKTAPDVLLLNEFEHDDNAAGLQIFLQQYLAEGITGLVGEQ